MDSRDMQVIGLCRFSYPALGGFQVEHDSIKDRIAYLYAPERLQERFRTFRAFTLPALRAQTDRDFTLAIVVGSEMPETALSQLHSLVADLPQARILARPPAPHREVMRDAINSLREDRGQPCLQFRMDDDDAVAVDFIEKLRNAAQNLRPLLRANRHVAIDFNHGFIATPSAAGITACPVVEPLWTPALAMSSKPRVTNTIMNFSHNRIGHKMPVLGLPDEAMFIRGHNDHNDSRQGANVRKRTLVALDDEARALFLSRFNIDEEQVRQIYGEA